MGREKKLSLEGICKSAILFRSSHFRKIWVTDLDQMSMPCYCLAPQQGCLVSQVKEVLSRLPPVSQKFAKFWICKARLMEQEGDLDVLPMFEEAVRVVLEVRATAQLIWVCMCLCVLFKKKKCLHSSTVACRRAAHGGVRHPEEEGGDWR